VPVSSATPVLDRVRDALTRVNDPQIRRPITELGMVAAADETSPGQVRVEVLLTVSGCPMKDTLRRDVTAAVMTAVILGIMAMLRGEG